MPDRTLTEQDLVPTRDEVIALIVRGRSLPFVLSAPIEFGLRDGGTATITFNEDFERANPGFGPRES